MKKSILVVLIMAYLVFSQEGYNDTQVRYAGLVDDVKYVGKNNHGNLFIVCTDDGRIYTINCDHIPYFSLKDSVMEYWMQYKLRGIGVKGYMFFYPVVK